MSRSLSRISFISQRPAIQRQTSMIYKYLCTYLPISELLIKINLEMSALNNFKKKLWQPENINKNVVTLN